jgi:hypothetical protein
MTVVQRAPWLVAGPFGLLHGLGFAGALAEGGSPGEIPLALFAFNVGIELGQLAFVAVVLVAMAALCRLPSGGPATRRPCRPTGSARWRSTGSSSDCRGDPQDLREDAHRIDTRQS